MEYDRRTFCLAASSSLALPLASSSALARNLDGGASGYRSIAGGGASAKQVRWNGRMWKVAGGPAWAPGMEHSIQLTANKARFELRDTPNDRGANDDSGKRRAELSGSKQPPRLANGVMLWGAHSFNHHGWANRAGMAAGQGGVHGQVHIGSRFGGSPAIAFRRYRNGNFRVTTRGERDERGTVHHDAPLAFDTVHDLVWAFLLDPTAGSLAVWLDGRQIVDVRGASIGSSFAESYWNIGAYYAGGIACPIVCEVANHVYPDRASLSARIARPPAWPAN